MPKRTIPYSQGASPELTDRWVAGPGGGSGLICSLTSTPTGPPQLEEEKAALLGQQRRVEQEATLAREEQERLEQLRLEQEVDRQGLEGSLRVAEQAREALEHQVPTLHQERCRLQEQLAQVGVCGGWGVHGEGVVGSQPPAPCAGVTHRLRSLNLDLNPALPLLAGGLGEATQPPHASVTPSVTWG